MTLQETLDRFFADFALPLTMRAGAEYNKHGRGILIVGFGDPEVTPFSTGYLTQKRAEALGFSTDFQRAIRDYNPTHEALIFLNCGREAKLLVANLDGTGGAPVLNN